MTSINCYTSTHTEFCLSALRFNITVNFLLVKNLTEYDKKKKYIIVSYVHLYQPGPSCSKLTMLLVNVWLNLPSLNMNYRLNVLLKKCEQLKCICKSYSHFFSKNTCELLTRTVNILTTNKQCFEQLDPDHFYSALINFFSNWVILANFIIFSHLNGYQDFSFQQINHFPVLLMGTIITDPLN